MSGKRELNDPVISLACYRKEYRLYLLWWLVVTGSSTRFLKQNA